MSLKAQKEWEEKQKSGISSREAQNRWVAANYSDKIKAVGEQISSRVNTWLQNHSNYISNYNDRYSGRNFDYSDSYVSDSSDWLNTVTTQKGNFDKEAENILSYLDRYKDFFNEDYVKSVTEAITGARDQQSSVLKSATEDNSYWSNFKTQEDYEALVRIYGPGGYQQKYSSMGYEDIMSSLSSLSDGEEKDWLSYNQSTLLRNALAKNEDFDELTKYEPTGTGEWKRNFWSGNISHDYSDIQYDYINKNEKAIEIQGANDINNNASLYGYDKSFLQQMTDDEIAIYNYLYKKNGKDAANEYLSYMESEFTRRDREESQKEWAEYSKANPVTSSLFSAIMAPTKVLSAVGQLADYADDGAIDQNAAYNKFSYIPSTIRAQVSSDIESGAWGKVGSYGYQIGMSMGDFLVTTAATGGPMTGFAGEILNLGLMGSGAMADTVVSAKDRGLSDDQALLLGGIAGGAEALFEKIGIDALFKSNMAEGAFKYIVKNMAAEGFEEGGTNIANFAADLIISKDKSEWNIAINDYMSKGLSEKEAFVEAMKDQLDSVALDMIGGAISGGVLGGVGAVGNYIGNARPGIAENKNALETYAPVQNELVAEGLESAKKSDSNILAREYKKILDKGGNLSGYQIRSLVEANQQQFAVEDVDTIAGAVKERLTALGESGKLEVLAKAIAKQTAGETLTVFEKNAIKNSKFGNRVVNELNAENIRSGEYSSDWTGNIGTNVINAEEYGRIVKAIDDEQSGNKPRISLDGEKLASSEGISLPESESVAEAQKSAPTESDNHIPDTTKMVTEVAEDAPTKTEEAKSTTEAETSDAKQGETKTVTLEEASKKYGAQAQAMVHTYTEGQDVAKYDEAYKVAYDMGASGVAIDYAKKSETVSYLTERQIELAHEAGKASSDERASAIDAKNKAVANGKTGRKKGTVKGEGVTIADLKKTFNDPQGKAYKFLTDVSEVTGIDIVLYKSEANADGVFEGDQGRFEWRDDKLYIDINAGLGSIKDAKDLQKYALLRTFSHEFTHFIEKWNPVMYNEFRKVVFDTLTERGENVDNLIETKRALDNSGKMTYEKASREVVAEAMTDILPDTNFISELAEKHKTIFNKLLERLKEFVQNLRDYFSSLGNNPSREANALKEQIGDSISYVENIVKLFDKAAMQAVENYQSTVAVEGTDINGLTDSEQAAIMAYKSSESYTINAKMREGIPLDEHEQFIADNLVSALEKLPIYTGTVYRNIQFDGYGDAEARDSYIAEHTIGDAFLHQAFTSSSVDVDGYPLKGKFVVHHVIQSINGRNLEGYGNNFESEVLFTPETYYITDKIEYASDGTPTIYLTEVTNGHQETKPQTTDGRGNQRNDQRDTPRESGQYDTSDISEKGKMQRLQTQNSGNSEVQSAIPERGTDGNINESDRVQGVQAEVTETGTASEKLASKLLDEYINIKNLVTEDGRVLTSKELYALADEAFGGTQAEGTYNRKDAYDAMELAVNKFLLNYAAIQTRFNNLNGNAKQAASAVKRLEHLLELLPTQNVRTQEMEDFQQFSTPPNIAYLAAWAANITSSDFVLEPSAGIGGLAVFAKAWGAEVAVNELSKRRLEVLRSMGFDHMFNENAEHIDNILPDNISPSVVIMNPPFSSTAGRTTNNKTSNAEKHIDQALARLRDGGRLVAVLGKSMNNNDYYKYWDKLRKSVNIRANLSIDGDNYKKYGTTWGVQIVVIDKTGPQTGETVTGRFTDLTEVPNVLEEIRNDRSNVEENRPASRDNGISKSVSDGGNKQSDTGNTGSSERSVGSTTDTKRTENRKSVDGNKRTGDRTDGKGVTENSSSQTERQDGGTDREARRTDLGNGDSATESSISDRHQPEQSLSGVNDTEQVSDDGVYATFIAPEIPVTGGKKHPAVLVESAAMAAVSMPKATYKVKLPANVIKNNLSDAQLVTVTYAGQAHEQKLPDGRRKGFFVGDGTGVGKGRQIAGIILDNFMQGRNKAVWISKNNDLYGDAIRDWTATTGRSKDEVVNHNKIKSKDKISIKEGILYSTYDTLKSEKGGNRLEQIVEWLGEDFDGVIAFDEAHNMGNLFGKKGKFGKSKGSEKARAGVELQRRLPNARIVYVSATAATEVDNLAYAERIGLWGQGTAFTNAQDFISKIGSSGLAAMELVIRDMKAMGTYVARSISYNGVNYDTVEHALDPMQTEIYNTMSRAWQKTMSNVQSALDTTGGRYNSTERQRALGNFYSGMQRFYNQVLTSMSMPSVIADMRRELDAGRSCVLQIVNTNEAQQNKQLAEAKANGESLDNLDLTPREALIGYLMNSFPTQMFEEYTDEDGNLRSRPVIDSAGNPVQSKETIKQRDALVTEVNQMSIPDGPLEMLFDAFGPEMVAENTGRSRRVVPKKKSDGSITRVEERRTLNHRTADVQAFQDGKKRILVFSDAGGTGKSYHADRTEKNQQLRIHYVLQPGWVASNAVQGFGRTHRSNEASAPIYKLVTTNIKGQKRFTSTIARRLDQLGALTKGQRDTGSGMFGAKDNLETDLAKDSLREFYRRLGKNLIEGVNGMKTLDRLGLKEKFTDEYGGFKLNDNLARDISTFLNRILALEVDEQNVVFDAFISIYEMELEAAIQSGTLDTGMENVKADKIEVADDKVIRKDDNTGSETHYIQAKTYTKPKVVTTVEEMSNKRSGFIGIYKTESGAVKAVFRIADKTSEWGAIQKQYRLIGPNLGAKTVVWNENTLTAKAEAIDKTEWQKEWDNEVKKVPEYNEDTLHMLTGALLPIWNSLPQEGNTKVKRLITDGGDAYLGRVIDKDLIDGVLGKFDINRTKEVFTAQQVMDKAIDDGVRFYLTNNKVEIFRSRVSGEWRLEITQPYNTWYLTRTYPGLIQERIQYRDRYFIPVGERGIDILEKILIDNPVRSTADEEVQAQSRDYLKATDSDYIKAVNQGDMDTAQSMVDEAAREAGYTVKAYHGTKSDFTKFDKTKAGENHGKWSVFGAGFYFSPSEDMAMKWGEKAKGDGTAKVMPVYLNVENMLPANKPIVSDKAVEILKSHGWTDEYDIKWQLDRASRFVEVLFHYGYTNLDVQELFKSMGYDGIDDSSLSNGKYRQYVVFDSNKIKSADTVTYDADGNVIPLSERFNKENDDIQYQQRTNTLSDRDVLAFAADEVDIDGLAEGEQEALRIFKERIESLRTLEDERAEQGRLYREQQFGQNVDKAAAAETLNRMHVLDSKIETANADLLDVQNKTVLRSVLQKARKVVEKNQRAHDQEILDRWRDRQKNSAAIKKYRERIEKDVKDMSDWALKPNNKDIMKHIPDVLKDSVIPFITSIDFTSKQQLRGGNATKADNAFKDRLEKLTKAVKSIDPKVLYDGNYDLSPNFLPNLEALVSAVNAITKKNDGTYVINQMTSEELRALSHVVRNLKTFVKQVNRFHYNAMFQFVSDAGDSSIEAMSTMQDAKRRIEAGDKLNNWVFWQNIRPAYAFERFGEGGVAIYDGLRRGQSKLAFNTKELVSFAETAYTEKQVKQWSEDVITIDTSDGQVRMPIAMAMSFYELSKDNDGLRHILDGGVRVATFKDTDKKITTDNGHKLTQKDVFEIIDALTDEQKAVADKLQKFMAEVGGKWGNYVSVKRFGEELFGNPTYFPINSDGQHLEATVEEHPNEASLYALLNMSFTKARNEFANNRIILYNIFDVFANHMASMAQYNALALPVLDAIKWFNYQQKSEPDEFGNTELISTVREQMDRVYGVPNDRKPGSGNKGYAQQFVLGILKDFNGTGPQGTPYDSMGMKALHVYNKAQVSANLRVVIQQPLAISRAAMLIDPDAIFKGMNLAKAKENIEEMQKYSGIAAWKSLGFYDVNISRGVTHLIKHDKTWIDKVTDVGMWGAEKLDILTWAAMWGASKEQVKKKDIKPSDKDFYKEVTKLFEDVIYKTQVVDSTLTKSEYMRSKGVVARITSSFMSEPVTTASMALDAYDKFRTDMQKGMTRQQAWKKNGKAIARMSGVFAVGALLNASIQAIADAFRDDDDYQEFYEKWLEAFTGNAIDELMPINKLPILSDFYDLAKELASIFGADTYGNPPQSVIMQWYDSLVNGFEIIYDKIMGEDTNYTWYGGIFKLLQAASGVSGLPMASLTREVITAWNNTVGAMAPSLKVKSYDPSDLSNIKLAYKDGYLTSEEAMKAILDKGLAENENDAYYIIQGWDSGDESYSKYDTIYDAIRKGESIDSAIGDLVSHGHKESGVMSTVKGEIGKWYKGGDISKQQAIDMLTKYAERFGMSSDDITKLVNEWSCKVVTGIEYNDIKSEFMEGNISASRAIEMYVRYGGKTKEKATEDVAVLQFIKENPEVEGKISSYKAVELYTTYCEDADISAETFANAYSYKGKDGVKKEEVLEYIDSLDLTRKQKNSLYYALGYAESNLWEAPW